MNNKVKNPKQEVPKGREMNDCDMLNSILNIEKNMSNNYSTALNEASNDDLYDDLIKIYKDTQDCQRRLYNLSFKNGWYELEEAEENKIREKHAEFSQKLDDLE
jgi:spore coat protein CotF